MVKNIKENIDEEYSEVTDSDYKAQQINEEKKKSEVKINIINKEKIQQRLNQMQAKFEDIILRKCQKKQVSIVDHMSIISEKNIKIEEINVNDDIQREVQFYQIALTNVQNALIQLEKQGVITQKPDDFLAQMYKHDKVMQKIKNRLVQQQVKIQNYEEKQMRLDNKKFQKNLKVTQDKMKHKEKRTNLQAIESWKSEIKQKGDKAKDLSEFIIDKNKRFNKFDKNKVNNDFDNRKNNDFNNKRINSDFNKRGNEFNKRGNNDNKQQVQGIKKSIYKKQYGGRQSYQKFETKGNQKGKSQGNSFIKKKGMKQQKQKRPGKVARKFSKGNTKSGKGGKRR